MGEEIGAHGENRLKFIPCTMIIDVESVIDDHSLPDSTGLLLWRFLDGHPLALLEFFHQATPQHRVVNAESRKLRV